MDALQQGRSPRVLSADWPLGHLPKVSLSGAAVTRLMHGQAVAIDAALDAPRIRLYDEAGRFMGIGEGDGHGSVQPRRLFVA
jgi:tRNA U55 pseudouridine synthase TruB